MPETAYARARRGADARTEQERNRDWWESLPMTYEPWDARNRSTTQRQVVDKFLDTNPWLNHAYFSAFKGKKVLEIGCGAGPATYLFAESGAQVTAIDLTEQAVELTIKHVEGLNVSVERMDAESLAFPDASFDHVFTWGVLHHTARPERAFSELIRVLRPGGTALVMVYNRTSARYWLKGAIWLLLRGRLLRGDNFNTVQRFFTDGYYHRHFTAKELVYALRPMKVERISVTHMANRMLPVVPLWFDAWCKGRWGFLLVAELRK